MFIHSNIKYLRNAQSLTQKELGKKVGIERHNIEAYEGITNPPYDKLIIIADYFDVSLDDIVRKDLTIPAEANAQGTP